jgi:hypothetical protein
MIALTVGWRMASAAMRLAILAARRDTFSAPIDEPHFEPVLT